MALTTVNSGGIKDDSIVNADIKSDAAIAKSKLASLDIVNADINASAAIAGSKISPDFGSQNIATTGNISAGGDITITNTNPKIALVDSNNTSDFEVQNDNGNFNIEDTTNTANRLRIDATGGVNIPGNTDFGAGVDVTGNITVSGTVDGVDIAALNTTVGTKAALTGSTNNTICTVTGANAIQGEANLTFDGTTLTTSTDVSITGASGNTRLNFNRTDAAGSNGNQFGLLKFHDNNANQVAGIEAIRESAVDDAAITFKTRPTGGSVTERVRIDSSGNVGINTASPTAELDIERATGTVEVQLQSRDSSDCFVSFGDNSDADVGQIKYAHSDNSMSFTTNAGEKVRIDSNGQLVLSNGSMSTAYGNSICGGTNLELDTQGVIKFRTDTNQKASITDNGLCFGSDSAAANALDDYEEGTFTPAITFGDGNTGLVHNVQVGRYTKVGNRVFATLYVHLSDKGSSTGTAKVGGLPFSSSNIQNFYCTTAVWMNSINFGNAVPTGYLPYNDTKFRLERQQTSANAGVWGCDNSNFLDSSDVMLNISYQTG